MKKIFLMLLAIVLIFGLSGCGTGHKETSSGSSYSGGGSSSSSGSSSSQTLKHVAVYFYNDTSDDVKVIYTYDTKQYAKYFKSGDKIGIPSDADSKGTNRLKFYGASGATDGLFLYEYYIYDDIGHLDKTLCFNYFYNGGKCE